MGFEAVEVSENPALRQPAQDLDRPRRGRRARNSRGDHLKDIKTAEVLIGQAHDCLDAGADVVLVEAAEMIIDGEVQEHLTRPLVRISTRKGDL